jgi:hypothetical protein
MSKINPVSIATPRLQRSVMFGDRYPGRRSRTRFALGLGIARLWRLGKRANSANSLRSPSPAQRACDSDHAAAALFQPGGRKEIAHRFIGGKAARQKSPAGDERDNVPMCEEYTITETQNDVPAPKHLFGAWTLGILWSLVIGRWSFLIGHWTLNIGHSKAVGRVDTPRHRWYGNAPFGIARWITKTH